MHYRSGLQARVTTVEEFLKRSGGGGGEPPREPNAFERIIRDCAEKLIRRQQNELESSGRVVPSVYVQNRERIKSLSEQFKKVTNPDFEGTVEAVKVLGEYVLARLCGQKFSTKSLFIA